MDAISLPEVGNARAEDDALEFKAPPGSADLGMNLAVTSISIFFLGALLAYVAARTGALGHVAPGVTKLPSIPMPVAFWFSTFFILLSSVLLHGATVFARNAREVVSGRFLAGAAVTGWIFLAIQVPGMRSLLASHRALAEAHVLVYALIAVLVGIHAVHVLGGLLPMTVFAARVRRRPFDTTRAPVLRRLEVYWHVLAALWVVMFNTILLVD